MVVSINTILSITIMLYWIAAGLLIVTGKYPQAAIWFLYGTVNVVLLWSGMGAK